MLTWLNFDDLLFEVILDEIVLKPQHYTLPVHFLLRNFPAENFQPTSVRRFSYRPKVALPYTTSVIIVRIIFFSQLLNLQLNDSNFRRTVSE